MVPNLRAMQYCNVYCQAPQRTDGKDGDVSYMATYYRVVKRWNVNNQYPQMIVEFNWFNSNSIMIIDWFFVSSICSQKFKNLQMLHLHTFLIFENGNWILLSNPKKSDCPTLSLPMSNMRPMPYSMANILGIKVFHTETTPKSLRMRGHLMKEPTIASNKVLSYKNKLPQIIFTISNTPQPFLNRARALTDLHTRVTNLSPTH